MTQYLQGLFLVQTILQNRPVDGPGNTAEAAMVQQSSVCKGFNAMQLYSVPNRYPILEDGNSRCVIYQSQALFLTE